MVQLLSTWSIYHNDGIIIYRMRHLAERSSYPWKWENHRRTKNYIRSISEMPDCTRRSKSRRRSPWRPCLIDVLGRWVLFVEQNDYRNRCPKCTSMKCLGIPLLLKALGNEQLRHLTWRWRDILLIPWKARCCDTVRHVTVIGHGVPSLPFHPQMTVWHSCNGTKSCKGRFALWLDCYQESRVRWVVYEWIHR